MSIRFSKTHEWLKNQDGKWYVGISDYAQDALGDIVFVDMPQVGDKLTAGESFCEVESVKAVSEVNSPVDGVVTAINESLENSPELLNQNPYENWIIEVEVHKEGELMSQAEYDAMDKE